jgi:transketolase
MRREFDLKQLRRRLVEIDYTWKHRHLPGSLSALPIIAEIYADFDLEHDVFILSKGHACAAHYAVLEACGYSPNCAKVHPDRDETNGITMTSGSLGHGLPTAVGIAWAKRHNKEPGKVHVLIGDGESQEGTTWEALHLAAMFELTNLVVHLDWNQFQGSEALLTAPLDAMLSIFPIRIHATRKGYGIKRFESAPQNSVHLVTEKDFTEIMEELA